ncbi:MAG: MlaD family protein [Polyangiaceae bacterium]
MASKQDIKVGAFVLLGLVVTGIVVFLIGDERSLFEPKVEFQAVFEDVQGLKTGSTARMGGVDVGSVTGVRYSKDPADLKLYVTISVVRDESRRIREDSVVSIEGKGLLGDKMLVITAGDPSKNPIEAGGTIPSKASSNLEAAMAKLSGIGDKAEKIVDNLERTTSALADDQFTKDLKGTVHSLNNILQSVDKGDGYASKILNDPAEAQKLSRALTNLEQTSSQLNRTLSGVNSIVRRVETGPGLVHEVVYGEQSAKSVAQFGSAAEELALTLKGVRQGNGIARSVIYGDDQTQQIMGNLNAMSKDLRQIVADVRRGKGTVGALLVDPSVYEDLKVVLGNVERNKTLRALVRYSIKQGETAPKVEVADPQPTPSVATSGGASAGAGGARAPKP